MQIGLRSLALTTAEEHPSERNYTPCHGDALHKSVSSKAAIICVTVSYAHSEHRLSGTFLVVNQCLEFVSYAVVVQFCDKPQILADQLGEVKYGLYLSQNVGNRLCSVQLFQKLRTTKLICLAENLSF